MKLKRYNRLKAAVDKAAADQAKAQGTVDFILSQLNKEFGVSSLKEAEAKYEKLQAEEQKAETEFEAAQSKFQRRYQDILTAQ